MPKKKHLICLPECLSDELERIARDYDCSKSRIVDMALRLSFRKIEELLQY